MLKRRPRDRRGVTLIESIVAMTIGGIVLALVAAIATRQQRVHADIGERAAIAGQLRQAAALLPIELRGVASAAGDLREARDTAIEFRAPIATAVVCDTSGESLVLSPSSDGATTFGGYLSAIAVGDTAWLLTVPDSAGEWTANPIASVATSRPGNCAPVGPRLSASAASSARIAIRLTSPLPPDAAIGSVIRITRQMRYSEYRGGDSRWYLGAREWNASAARFNTIQPLSGPFASPSARGVVFEYFDSAGVALLAPVADTREIALVRVALRAQSRGAMRAFGGGAQHKSLDTATVAVALRNRR